MNRLERSAWAVIALSCYVLITVPVTDGMDGWDVVLFVPGFLGAIFAMVVVMTGTYPKDW